MGKSVGQGQRQNVAMKGGQTEYRCQEKAARKEESGYLFRPEEAQNIVG